MGKVRLMNRIDTKYVATPSQISVLLRELHATHLIQQIDGRTEMPYYTRYFDTPDTDMYRQHQRGKLSRQKVRIRRYEESATPPMLEIKTKSNKGRTKKVRVEILDGARLEDYRDFFAHHSSYDPSSLLPQIENHFLRLTLTDREMTERITIDTSLEFHNLATGCRMKLPNICIIEWKRDGHKCHSALEDALRKMRIRPTGFSKYCIGMAFTNEALRQNRIKKKLRKIRKLNSMTSAERTTIQTSDDNSKPET